MRNLLGGKGARMPVPAGFTITTECCTEYYNLGCKYPAELEKEVNDALSRAESMMGRKFGDKDNPLLVSCRSGARSSMPGMMETVLNIGLCSATIPGMIAKTGNPRFVYDAYRRLIMMYSDVVMEKAEGIEPAEGQGIRVQLDRMLGDLKAKKGYKSDTDLTEEDLKQLCADLLQGTCKTSTWKRVPRQRIRAALGRYRSRVQILERQACHRLPPHRGYSR